MKVIRRGTFETNSSSSHSLVIRKSNILNKEELESIGKYDFMSRVFGSDLYDLVHMVDEEWDEEGNSHYYFNTYDEYNDKRQLSFDFCRGEPRTYNDFIHKTAFVIGYYIWEDSDVDEFLDKVDKMLEKYISTENFKNEFYYDKINFIIEELIKNQFRDPKLRKEIIYSEFDRDNPIMYTLIHNDGLLEKFLFNSLSYISISGDEYQSDYLKGVGSEAEYFELYGSDNGREQFEKRLAEVYKEGDYQVERGI